MFTPSKARAALVAIWAMLISPLYSTTIIPYTDLSELARASDAVVVARALAVQESEYADGTTYSDMLFTVERSIGGALPEGSLFPLRPFTSRNGDLRTAIEGDFQPEAGKTYLLFLDQSNGIWRPMALSYYVLQEVEHKGTKYWTPSPEMREIHAWPRPDGIVPELPATYQQDVLEQALYQVSNDPDYAWPGNSHLAVVIPELEAAARALPADCNFDWGSAQDPILIRWENASISLLHNPTDAPADIVSRLTNVETEYSTKYEGTNLDYTGAANPTYSPNCNGGSARSGNFLTYMNGLPGAPQNILVIFEDPCNEIPDLNNCAGTLAIGGFYFSGATHQYKGDTWNKAQNGFSVVNNDVYPSVAPCNFSAGDYEILLTHEFTHSHGMRHLTAGQYSDQNMYPFCCNPVGSKDEECMDYVYESALPVTLVAFELQGTKAQTALLSWETSSEYQNDYFEIERSANGTAFAPLTRIEPEAPNTPGTYSFEDKNPLPGKNYYRLKQVDLDGTVNYLGIRQVSFEAKTDFELFPNPLDQDELSIVGNWEGGLLEIVDVTGSIVWTYNIDPDNPQTLIKVPSGTFTSGIYYVTWTDMDERITKKLVKQ